MYCRCLAAGLAAVTLACASSPVERRERKITTEQVLVGAPLTQGKPTPELIDEAEILALSPEMKDFIDSNVDLTGNGTQRLRQLAVAIIGEGTFGLEYDDITRTAAETFAARRGNCLSFSNMFVAMARYMRLNVHFQEVDIPPDWTREEGVFVLNRHVNVVVELSVTADQVVDFNIDDFRATYPMKIIGDSRALAHFNNNMGVEKMLAGDTVAALHYYRRAILGNDRGFSPAWTNLATLYLREGLPHYAETAYLQALDADRMDYVAMSNLAGLYESLGDSALAAKYRKKVNYHRMRNPYYRFELARKAFYRSDYDSAIDHLKFAVRKRPQEDQFYFLLGLSYLKKDDQKSARYWLAQAEKVASQDSLKKKYSSKIEHLQAGLN